MEEKEEISDTDSGIILYSGHDSPVVATKDLGTHTRAVKLKWQSLQDRIELCILELKKLCIREAELTGNLCSDYPLLPGEKPPQIRKRVGAAFKLNEQSILHRGKDSELCSVEAKLALQQQIFLAAHKLCHEEKLNKAVKKSRVQQCKREEQKLKELQDSVFQLCLEQGRSSPQPRIISQKYHGTSDNSSLSDSAVLDEEELTSQSSQASSELPSITEHTYVPSGLSRLSPFPSGPFLHPPDSSPSPCQSPLKDMHPCHGSSQEYEPAPIQNSPWKESSLDQPYQKQKSSHPRSTSCSPAVSPRLPQLEARLEENDLKLLLVNNAALRHTQISNIPSTPKMHLQEELSLRVPKTDPPKNPEGERGRMRGTRRRLTDVILNTPEYYTTMYMGNLLHSSSIDNCNSEHLLAPSYTSSPYQEVPDQLCQTDDRYHYTDQISLAYVTHGNYNNSSAQLSPRLYKGYIDDGRGHNMCSSRMHIKQQMSPRTNSYYKYGYKGAPVYQDGIGQNPHYSKLSRAPSLKEHPQHPSRALPRHVVSNELKSWHQRCQLRPRSLDRQGAVCIQNVPLRESRHSPQHDCYNQVPPRAAERTPALWYEEDNIGSQV